MESLQKLFSLKNKNVLITGSTGYLGSYISKFLADSKANVFLQGKDKVKVAHLYKKLKNKNCSVTPLVFDLLDEEEMKNVINIKLKNNINVVVNNAYSGSSGTTLTSNSNDFRNSYEITMVATNNLVKILYPQLIKSKKKFGDASIINISSIYGLLSPDLGIYNNLNKANPPYYGAAKAALIQYTKYTACEFAKDGIRVNSISPGHFPSPKFQKIYPNTVKKLISKIPMKRIGKPEDIIGPLMYLATSSSKYVTGTNIIVDGGYSTW